MPRRTGRVLMLAYYFPPLGGGGVQRTLKHAKYLPEFGFDPVVVTTRGTGHKLRDPSLASEIPAGATVLRPPELPLHVGKWAAESLLRRAGLPTRLARFLAWPDEFAGWIPGALVSTLRAARRPGVDVLYSTSSPVSAHVVALLAHRLTGLPWVADFRDPWTRSPEGRQVLEPLSEALERRVVREASRLVVVDDTVELLDLRLDDPRRVVIPNGVDPDDVPRPNGAGRGETFRLAHVGMLYGQRDAAPVLAALRKLVARGDVDPERVDLRFVGDARFGPEVDLSGLPVTLTGSVDHGAAIAEMAGADALFLYQPSGWRASSGKIFEYLATGRPVLCVAPPDNLASRLVAELQAGVCAAPNDADGIERAIRALYEDWTAGRLAPSTRVRDEALRRFSRRELARRLAGVLDTAIRAE